MIDINNRLTHSFIMYLEPSQVFVFGSNESGRHGMGAAKTALQWGAKFGVADGLQGHTYGIPTKGVTMQTLPLSRIKVYVDRFIEFAKKHPELTFLVTEIGCGLAGYVPNQIAPLFMDAVNIKNVHLPDNFWKVLIKNK
jgi:hypothetical protein